jgi:hypothetical protein
MVTGLVRVAKETEGAEYLKAMFAIGMSALDYHMEKEGGRSQ